MLVKKIVGYISPNDEEYVIYEYGVRTILELGISTITSIIISFLYNKFIEGIAVIMIFATVRSYVGGLHFKSFLMCYLVSNINIILCLFLSDLKINFDFAGIIIYVLLILIIMYVLAPVQSENNPLSTKEVKVIKKKTKKILSVLYAGTIYAAVLRDMKWIRIIISSLTMIFVSMIIEKAKIKKLGN